MARKRRVRKCEFCGDPARITIQTRERRGITWLCGLPHAIKCQDRYYRLLAKEVE